jgi:hypothetical protein
MPNFMFQNQLKQLNSCFDAINGVQFQQDLDLAVNLLLAALNQNKPVIVCGNGALRPILSIFQVN